MRVGNYAWLIGTNRMRYKARDKNRLPNREVVSFITDFHKKRTLFNAYRYAKRKYTVGNFVFVYNVSIATVYVIVFGRNIKIIQHITRSNQKW